VKATVIPGCSKIADWIGPHCQAAPHCLSETLKPATGLPAAIVRREMVREKKLTTLRGTVGKLPDPDFRLIGDKSLVAAHYAVDQVRRQLKDMLGQKRVFDPGQHPPAAVV